MFIDRCGRQIVVIVCDSICLGRRVVPLEVGDRPETIFSTVRTDQSEPFPAALTKQLC